MKKKKYTFKLLKNLLNQNELCQPQDDSDDSKKCTFKLLEIRRTMLCCDNRHAVKANFD